MCKTCPLCGGTQCSKEVDSATNSILFECRTFNREIKIDASVYTPQNKPKRNRLFNLIFEHCIQKRYYGEDTYWYYYYEPDRFISMNDNQQYVNLVDIPYPQTLAERIDRILMNLQRCYPHYGDTFITYAKNARIFFLETDNKEECLGIGNLMTEMGYLREICSGRYSLSAKGWNRIEDINRQYLESKQGFIAMAFREDTATIRAAFHKAISAAGYAPLAIDEKEHNNQIVPEIFYEINRSRFLVMDVTFPNFGAYYEAGYALGKGKQVIICCRKAEFDDVEQKHTRPHFDIQQKSMVVWETEEELIEKLMKRIKATVNT